MIVSHLELLATLAAAALISALLIVLLHPLLVRYALARPNGRSSHREPTPQGGGIAVIAAIILVVGGLVLLFPAAFGDPLRLGLLFAATAALAVVGAVDDIRPLAPMLRLILQTAAVAIVIAALPADLRVVPQLPWWLERAALLVGTIWFVNLVNFMDGIDWITVAEVVPVTTALALFGAVGILPADATLVAVALCGGMIGFAPFNRPVARLFLGDVGSLPIGLLLAWLLIGLAGSGHLAAALLLPLYYLADSTITLLRRFLRGDSIMQAHRQHFYQKAVDNGLSVSRTVSRVFATNVALVGAASLTLYNNTPTMQVTAVTAGATLVAALLWRLHKVSC